MNSIRIRLFIILTLATSVVWLSAAIWIGFGTQRELQQVLDTRLMEAARMVASLAEQGHGASSAAAKLQEPLAADAGSNVYARQLSCQIWSVDGRMVGRSTGAPDEVLSDVANGFSDRTINGEPWRVYSVTASGSNLRVLVGDRLALRDRLVNELLRGLLLPGLLILPVLALLILVNVGHGLQPLNRLTQRLQLRGPDDLHHIEARNPPVEIVPVIKAMNSLLDKVAIQRAHERSFTAYAAHELRTPLAGLRAQAQIARLAQNDEARLTALALIETAVDRTTRLIRQLLALAHLDATEVVADTVSIRLAEEIDGIVASLPPGPTARRQTIIDPALHRVNVRMNRELFHLAVRNLHENALQYSPAGGAVRWKLDHCGDEVCLVVEDEGAGLAQDELTRVTERFFRGRVRNDIGSGLGLAIVLAALTRAGAGLILRNRPDRTGLQAGFVITSMLKRSAATDLLA